MYFIPQISQNDCGVACLKMLLADINHDSNYLYLPYQENSRPLSYQKIIQMAEKYQLFLKGFVVAEKEEIINNQNYPLIVTIKSHQNVGHAVIVKGIRHHYVQIVDPDQGTYSLSLKRFFVLWDKTGLLIEKYENMVCPYIHQEKKQTHDLLIASLCQIMSTLSLILGIFFIDGTCSIYISISLIIAFIFFELMLRYVLFKAMNNIDKNFIDDLHLRNKDFKEFHLRFENYKKAVLLTPLNFLFIFLICGFLIFIMVLNDIHNILMIIAPICLTLVEIFYFRPFAKSKEEEISLEEKELYQTKNIDDYKEKEFSIHEKTYRLTKITLLKKYFVIATMIIVTGGIMLLNGIFSIPYIVFYLCLETALYNNFHTLFTYDEKKREYLIAKVRLNNIIHQDDEII